MPMSKLHAWTILKSASLGQEEGKAAVAALVGDEATEYQAHVGDLELDIANAITEISNESAELLKNSEVAQRLEFTPANEYTAHDYRQLVTIFEGSKFEKLHLSAFFRINNASLLFDAVKPAA